MPAFFNFLLAHSGEGADPELVHWIKERLDQIFGTGPWAVVIIIGVVIFLIPLVVTVVYLMQSGRRAAANNPGNQSELNQDVQEQEQA